jgi:uncharacterized protein YndB with AHSA1/START domain
MVDKKFSVPAGKPEVIVTGVFDAPRDRLFRALTDPQMIPKWWGPKRMSTTVTKMDVRKGGDWRFVQCDPEGKEFAFRGKFRDVKPPERLEYTFEFEAMPGHISDDIVTLEKRDGKTLETQRIVFESIADRDGMVGQGMEEGEMESLDRLEELVAKN